MNRFETIVRRLFRDDAGQDLIEYALLGALISVTLTARKSSRTRCSPRLSVSPPRRASS
jgi:hypothetical protein